MLAGFIDFHGYPFNLTVLKPSAVDPISAKTRKTLGNRVFYSRFIAQAAAQYNYGLRQGWVMV